MTQDDLTTLASLTMPANMEFMGRSAGSGSLSECLGVLAQIVKEQEQRIRELEAMVWPCGK